jgi:uncharacterized protein YcbK (DUF882 family)
VKLSDHFDNEEFVCPGDGQPGHEAHEIVVDPHLVEHLEQLRAQWGVPLNIVSGHRCRAWELDRGRSGASQHVYGRAADIPSGYATVSDAVEAGFTGIGELDGWAVHVDVRPGGPARWSY